MRTNSKMDFKGCSIYYETERRDNAKDWVVFLHGAGVDHRMFAEQLRAVPEEFNILRWDARSHGKSLPSSARFSMVQLLEDLLKLMEKENIGSAVFIGQSMGGNLAQEMAYYHPEKVKGMVLIDCTNNSGRLSFSEKLMLSVTKPLLLLYPWKMLVRQSADACSVKPEVRDYVEQCFREIGKETLIEILLEVTKCLHEDRGYRIRVPFLLLCGDNDRSGNIRKIAGNWAASEPECCFHMISNAGHNSNQDHPEEVNRHIEKYLRQLSNSPHLNE